jgi:hypothetical protein
MSIAQSSERLQIPEKLRHQLDEFRRLVWTVKTIEATASAAFGFVAGFLAMYVLDRFWDTPTWPRIVLFGLVVLAFSLIPYSLHRWVWRQRRPDQLARLLARKHPRIGDQLLGVIELAHDDSEQARSRKLVAAAIEQVAEDAAKRDFRDAVPNPRHKLWLGLLAVPALVTIGLFVAYFPAASNAMIRLATPWTNTPRYTFAILDPVPSKLVVPHGEPFVFRVKLSGSTVSSPTQAQAQIGERALMVAALESVGKSGEEIYSFQVPAQVSNSRLQLKVGDAVRSVEVEPMLRPELTSVVASVTLPDYLRRVGAQSKDVRGGSITLVKGSKATFSATSGRELDAAWVDSVLYAPSGSTVSTPSMTIDGSRDLQFRWKDRFGLAGKEPFTLKITARDDEAPSLLIEDLPRQKVVLDTELLNFKIRAQDDFGVKRVGLVWQGLDPRGVRSVAIGDRVLAGGTPDKESLEVAGAFSARSYGIEPQPIALRVFVEDYAPGRARVLSAPYTLFILNAEQHAIWLTEQLSKWHRQSLEVRDREMQLFETNKEIRAMAPADLDKPENRKKIEAQASAERANGRRLSNLTATGEDLVKQAMRNPEFGVGHLERWAEMLQILKDISENRMPSVADLLKQASQAEKGMAANSPGPKPSTTPGDNKSGSQGKPGQASSPSDKAPPPAPPSESREAIAANTPSNKAPMAGNNRAGDSGKPGEPAPAPPKPPSAVPSVVDGESSQQPPDKKDSPASPPSPPKTPRLTLATTTLTGGVKPGKPDDQPADPPAAQKVDEALNAQRDLLAEFDKVADEMNKVLANLEGSTLVKRLKAASRVQATVANKISEQVSDVFGVSNAKPSESTVKALDGLSQQEAKGSQTVSVIMDDMSAYFERRQYVRFKTVLDEMREKDVIAALRQLGDDLKRENGLSIAQAEFWSDTLDRWAEDLVDPAKSGKCPGSKAKGSLPPSVVLEVLQILEGEVNLREETRVAEQARSAIAVEESSKTAKGLSKNQDGLMERVVKVVEKIRELPDAEEDFAKELALLEQVAIVMEESTEILAKPETGAPAIAAETEAIELLLQSKRINPKGGGGGGGSNPGGGGRGTTTDSALALMGNGVNQKEVREDRGISQATGDSGASLPEEYRAGLDQYFNKLERTPAGK